MTSFGGEAFWLIVTNAALGLAILGLFLAVVWSVVGEALFPKNGRRV